MAKDKNDNGGTAVMEPPKQETQLQQQVAKRETIAIVPLKFRVMAGQHIGFDKYGQHRMWNTGDIVESYLCKAIPEKRDPVTNDVTEPEKFIPYKAADLGKFNQPGAAKFQAVHVDMPSSKGMKLVEGNPVMDEEDLAAYERNMEKAREKKQIRTDGNDDMFDSMSQQELIQYANENEIPFESENRDALLESIRQYERAQDPRNQ